MGSWSGKKYPSHSITDSKDTRHGLRVVTLLAALCCIGATSLTMAQSVQHTGTQAATIKSAEPYADGLRRWGASDSVAVTYFDPENVIVSPDAEKFLFVSFRGDLACDCNVYRLTVFSTAEVQRALKSDAVPKPLRVLTRRSAGRDVFAVWNPRWERDSETLTFQGVDERGIQQLYRFDVHTGVLTALTAWENEVQSYSRAGNTIIANVRVPAPASVPAYPVHAVTRSDLIDALTPLELKKTTETFVTSERAAPWQLTDSRVAVEFAPWLSSDGKKAIVARYPTEPPDQWKGYDLFGELTASGGKLPTDFPRFYLIDVERGRSQPVFDAPSGLATKIGAAHLADLSPLALWAEDREHVILINTALPLSEGDPERAKMAYIVGLEAETGRWSVIEPFQSIDPDGRERRIAEVGWITPGKELLVRHTLGGKPASGTLYTLKRGRWIGKSAPAALRPPAPREETSASLSNGLKITLEQSANDPPRVWAAAEGKRIALSEPDRALEGVWRAAQVPFQWHHPDGRTMTAGLLLPRDTSGRVPLVIQAFTYEPDRFAPDGPFTHAYAAQGLVARGMAVLNMNIPVMDTRSVTRTPLELTDFRNRVESVADALGEKGLIDRARVGLIGFSRGGFMTYQAITHPGKIPLAAAVVDDGFLGTYSYYLSTQAIGESARASFEGLYGGTFWQNPTAWLEREPSFNVDRVQTPAMFTVHSQPQLIYAIETIGAFALNRRPLEYLVFPNGRHQLSLPKQRAASQEASTDWMSFWLQGYEDPTPSKAAQYARWRTMRADNEQRLREAHGDHPSDATSSSH